MRLAVCGQEATLPEHTREAPPAHVLFAGATSYDQDPDDAPPVGTRC